MNNKRRVAIIGTNGIPANYGGFETLAENLVLNLHNEFVFNVYCSRENKPYDSNEQDVRLIYIPLRANGWQSLLYDTISFIHSLFISDIILVLGPSAGMVLILNRLFRKRLIVNYGGLNEWEREKYSWCEKAFLKFNFQIAAKVSDINVADNEVLKESILKTFNQPSMVIRYGGDHTSRLEATEQLIIKYPFLRGEYFITIARAQVDNNLTELIETFKRIESQVLVIVSNWDVSEYGRQTRERYKNNFHNVYLLDAIYDQSELDTLRSNAQAYIHTHSRCGTAPSLVEAICLQLPILSLDIPTNRETLKNDGLFFKDFESLHKILIELDNSILKIYTKKMKTLKEEYSWRSISQEYSHLFSTLQD